MKTGRKLRSASQIALLGVILFAAVTIFGIIVSFIHSDATITAEYTKVLQQNRNASFTKDQFQSIVYIGMGFGGVFSLTVIGLFLFCALYLKRAKGKGSAIVLLIISSVFGIFSIVSMLRSPIDGLVSLVGNVLTFIGGAMAVNAPDEEYEVNRLH